MGGDGGRRRRGAGGVGEVAAGERALEQRPPLHRLRRRPVRVRRRHLTRMGRPCPRSGRNDGGGGRGGRRGSCSPRFPVSDIAGLSIGGRCYSASCLLSGCKEWIGGGESPWLNIARRITHTHTHTHTQLRRNTQYSTQISRSIDHICLDRRRIDLMKK